MQSVFFGLAVRDFSTEELVEERKGKEKIFDEIRKKQVDEKKDEKKIGLKRRQKRGKRVWLDFFFFFKITIILVHKKLK